MEMRGLSKVIGEIRKASAMSKEDEQQVVEKELHKVRQKFKETKNMKGYDRKKNVCKILYIYMLGYEVDFGHMEGVELLSSDRYSEKYIGYLACTLFLNEDTELLTLITHSIKQDLISAKRNCPQAVCLALTAVANIGGKDFADTMADDVRKIALNRTTPNVVKKKALLCLLRLYRCSPERVEAEEIAGKIIEDKSNISVINAVITLILGFLGRSSVPASEQFPEAAPRVIRLLYKLILSKETSSEYVYYTVPAPWLQVKCFRVLQHYPMPTEGSLKNQITTVLNKIITTSERVLREAAHQKTRGAPARNNAMNAVLAEAINLVIHWDNERELPQLLGMSATILGRFITDSKDTNLRYLGLDLLARLSFCEEVFTEHIKKHQATIVGALRDPDISIRRKALDLLYVMVDRTNAGEIVGEMLDYLTTAEFAIKEALVTKIAILCEKYASDFCWYVDVILSIIQQAGDFVGPDVWQRVVHIVMNHPEIQTHAAQTVFAAVVQTASHETAVKVAANVLGEFGMLLPDTAETGALAQLQTLHSKWGLVERQTKSMLLTCYAKYYTQHAANPQVRERVRKILEDNTTHMDVEIQQRSTEYLNLITALPEEKLQKVFEPMPQFEIESCKALKAVVEKGRATTDQNVWQNKLQNKEMAEMQAREHEETAAQESLGAVLTNWQQEAAVTAFTYDVQSMVKNGVAARCKNQHLGCWENVALPQDFSAFLDATERFAEKEAKKSKPVMHPHSVFFKIGAAELDQWLEELRASVHQPQSDANPLGLQGAAGAVCEAALAEIDAQYEQRKQTLEQLLPFREQKEEPSGSALDDIFGGPTPTPAAEPAAAAATQPPPQTGGGIDDIFGGGPAPAAAPAQPAPAAGGLDAMFGGGGPAPAPAAQPAPAASKSALDDIFGGGAPAAQTAPPAAAHQDPMGGMDAMFGGPPAAAAPPPATQASYVSEQAQQEMAASRFPSLLTCAQGVLYEDQKLQVGVRSEYQGPQGRVTLYLGNKTQAPYTNVTLSLAPVPNCELTTVSPVADTIGAGAQAPCPLAVRCTGFFQGHPSATLHLVLDNGQPMSLTLKLPVAPTKFMEPLNLTSGQQFFQAWQATQSAVNPPQGKIYRSPRDIDLNGVEAFLTTSLKMKALRAVDNNQNNIVGSGYFTPNDWVAAPLPKQQFVVLVNIETNPQAKAARVTIKSPDAAVENAVHSLVEQYFQ
eukprot:TRINITY_DN22335_c0_g1_i1.p1 TRINITY_DN22335_c0_g1~~TRINITY_DN22335_c0_g1_i1.p1  ORF type:complete len:1205 (+),score=553.57 TRINITY_DN22335_c0_g1_i1:93-3707(+)